MFETLKPLVNTGTGLYEAISFACVLTLEDFLVYINIICLPPAPSDCGRDITFSAKGTVMSGAVHPHKTLTLDLCSEGTLYMEENGIQFGCKRGDWTPVPELIHADTATVQRTPCFPSGCIFIREADMA